MMHLKTTILLAFLSICPILSGQISRGGDDPAYRLVRERLADSAIPQAFIDSAFSHPQIQIHDEIVDKFNNPWEKKDYPAYRKLFVTEKRIFRGVKFYTANKNTVDAVSDSFGVDPFLLLSITGVESNYGEHHSQYSVFNALYTIIRRLPRKSNWAANQLAEYLSLCHQNKMGPQSISGSYAGAFGFGQFIPSSFNRFAVDFDGDGVRHHLEWPDVFGSIANYLKKNGYKGLDFSKGSPNWKAVWAYNHSENYVRAVLELREELKSSIESGRKPKGK